MAKTDIRLRYGIFSPDIGSFGIVPQTALIIAALQTKPAKLDKTFRKTGG